MDEKEVACGGWWSLPQALVWIVTRQEARVWEASGATAFDEVIRRKLAPNASLKDPPIPAEAAVHELKRAASKNQISILGRWRGTEEAKKTPGGRLLHNDRLPRSSNRRQPQLLSRRGLLDALGRPTSRVQSALASRADYIIKTQATNAPPPPPKVRGMSMWPSVDRSATHPLWRRHTRGL